jgi:hypothetical protein
LILRSLSRCTSFRELVKIRRIVLLTPELLDRADDIREARAD